MEELLSIFRNNAFSAATLDRVAPNITYVPQALGALNLFQSEPIRTTGIEVYMENGEIKLVPTSERGAPEPLPDRDTAELRYLKTVRLAQRDRVNSHELQDLVSVNLAAPVRLRNAIEEVRDRSSKMRSNNEMTLEHHRLGALQGMLLDADGTTVVRNYFTEFGVSEPVSVLVDFAAIDKANLVTFLTDNFVRPIMRSLKDRKTAATYVAALVGDTFWAQLTAHEGVRETFLNYQAAAALRNNNYGGAANNYGNAWGEFTFAGIRWMNYMGSDDGTTIAIPTKSARFFPVGARDVFKVYWAPGESMRDVNQKGQPLYVRVQPDPRDQMQEYVDIHVRNYPLHACLFPAALMRAHCP